MAVMKLSFALCVFSLLAVHLAYGAAPAPAADCSTLILNMADCLSFVSNDSTTTKPEGTCCSGLKTVLKENADCLCQAFKNSAQLGVVLNITKALSLPAACKVSTPATANCKLSLSPAGSPAMTPGAAPRSSTSAAPETAAATKEPTPAPAPGSFAPPALASSVGSLIAGIGVALFYSF